MKLKTILKTVLLAVVTAVLILIAGWFMIDRYKTYQGQRLFFQYQSKARLSYETHK